MAFDLTAMRSLGRVLIGDSDGSAVSDNDWRDIYLNPAYREWWRRFEHRPGNAGFVVLWTAGIRSAEVPTPAGKFSDEIYRVTAEVPTTGAEMSVRKSEMNRIRGLQESEHRRGAPDEWAAVPFVVGGALGMTFALYPLVDQPYYIHLYGRPSLAALTAGTDAAVLDPVSVRQLTRVAAYRAGLDLKIRSSRLEAIVAPLPPWVLAHFKIDLELDRKGRERDQVGYARTEA